jgi:hypothetical protein
MTQAKINEKLALEMAMQDVMDNMEELTLDFGFLAGGEGCFEILAIEPAEVPDAADFSLSAAVRNPFSAEIHALPRSRRVA